MNLIFSLGLSETIQHSTAQHIPSTAAGYRHLSANIPGHASVTGMHVLEKMSLKRA